MTTVAVIQARMTSTRLPGKVLLPALGRPMLDHMLERVARARRVDRIVVATTVNATDDPVAGLAATLGVAVHRGPEADVLGRFQGAVAANPAATVVRLTGDCPVIDPGLIDLTIGRYADADTPVDYATNAIPRSYPAGLDVEVFAARVLAEAAGEAVDPYDREHVTPFIYRRPERYRLASVVCEPNLAHERWTLDEPADYELLRRIIEALYPAKPDFDWHDVSALLDAHPDWRAINAAVRETPRPHADAVTT